MFRGPLTTALHTAALRGNADAISAMCSRIERVDTWDAMRQTALHVAAENGQHLVVTALLQGLE